jgi:hypothetical protein
MLWMLLSLSFRTIVISLAFKQEVLPDELIWGWKKRTKEDLGSKFQQCETSNNFSCCCFL